MENLFIALMIVTFAAAVVTLLTGIASMGKQKSGGQTSNKLMMLRVGLCALLLLEMVVFSIYFRA